MSIVCRIKNQNLRWVLRAIWTKRAVSLKNDADNFNWRLMGYNLRWWGSNRTWIRRTAGWRSFKILVLRARDYKSNSPAPFRKRVVFSSNSIVVRSSSKARREPSIRWNPLSSWLRKSTQKRSILWKRHSTTSKNWQLRNVLNFRQLRTPISSCAKLYNLRSIWFSRGVIKNQARLRLNSRHLMVRGRRFRRQRPSKSKINIWGASCKPFRPPKWTQQSLDRLRTQRISTGFGRSWKSWHRRYQTYTT